MNAANLSGGGGNQSGLERISALEVEIVNIERQIIGLEKKLDELITATQHLDRLLSEGRGAIRLARYIMAALVFAGFGAVARDRVHDFLLWLGR